LQALTTTLLLLLTVVLSGLVARALPLAIPRPLVQVGLGALSALVSHDRIAIGPELFFSLFVPPLLFLDGWRISNDQLLRDHRAILQLALGLVVFTVLGIGYFVHWLIPALPLTIAFALAAVVSPTDPLAVSAIAQRTPIPRRMMSILAGEALLNDATGLICLRFALAAAIIGTFSLVDALLSFLWVALGGLTVGFCMTWGTTHAKNWIAQRVGEESGSQIIVSLLTPFAAYLTAEWLKCSGILAAVAAGVTMSYVEASGKARPLTRMRRHVVWDAVGFSANGIVFVLLGEELPAILGGASETVRVTGHRDPWWLLLYALGINVALFALRFLWVWLSLRLSRFTGERRTSAPGRREGTSFRLIAAASLAGVRGAVTLAAVLTLPLVQPDGSPLLGRDLAIFLATSVILFSLVVASVGLPLALRGLVLPDESLDAEEDAAQVAAAMSAIAELVRATEALSAATPADRDAYAAASTTLIEQYRSSIAGRVEQGTSALVARHREAIEGRLLVVAVRAERATIHRMLRAGEIGSETAEKLVRALDLVEVGNHTAGAEEER
jgi:monovalent cation/hydrogen antiporter